LHSLKSAKKIAAASAAVLLISFAAVLGVAHSNYHPASASPTPVFGVFVGTSPAGEPVRQLLRIPSGGEPELIQWKLTLHQDAKTLAPTRYELRCDYGLTTPGEPGLARDIKTLQRNGVWTRSKGTKSDAAATVFELSGALSLLQVDDNILHVLNSDRSLMIGNGGWSYSLNRAERAEKLVDLALARSGPDVSYQISPVATGPAVLGVFEGRTPCLGVASELQLPAPASCMKAKWRVTLYQNPETLTPTKFRVEGTLFRGGALEGSWSRIGGHRHGSGGTVHRLTPAGRGPSLHLLAGDDNVLFFLNEKRQPLVGNIHFSYTLDRRAPSGPS
jgi:hypothetical protein